MMTATNLAKLVHLGIRTPFLAVPACAMPHAKSLFLTKIVFFFGVGNDGENLFCFWFSQ